jgi:uncharacterized membrane protein HdeD (DUF308 family)
VSHASPQAPEDQTRADGDAVHWAARLRFGTRTLLLGLTGVAAAAPLSTRGLVFNAIALALTGLALMLQLIRRPFGPFVGTQLVIAAVYCVAGAVVLLVPQQAVPGAYVLGAALLTAGVGRVYWAHRVSAGPRSAAIAPGVVSGLLGAMAITGWPAHAPWQLAFLVAAELVVAGVSSLQLGFAHWSRQRTAKLPG